jgi:hypothetical protein
MSSFGSITSFLHSNNLILQRSNKFAVNLRNPSGKTLNWMLCEMVNLPTNGIGSTAYQIDNKPNMYIPYTRNYDNNQFTVTLRENIQSNRHTVYPWLEEWLNLVVSKNPITRKYEISYYNDCLGSANFISYDLDMTPVFSINFYKIYPISVKPSQYSYEEMNTYNRIEASFVFEEFEIIK